MVKKARWTRQRNGAGSGGSGMSTPRKFTAPMPGIEDVFYLGDSKKRGQVRRHSEFPGNTRGDLLMEAVFHCLEGHVGRHGAYDHEAGLSGPELLYTWTLLGPRRQTTRRATRTTTSCRSGQSRRTGSTSSTLRAASSRGSVSGSKK